MPEEQQTDSGIYRLDLPENIFRMLEYAVQFTEHNGDKSIFSPERQADLTAARRMIERAAPLPVSPPAIELSTMVESKTLEPQVVIKWGDYVASMSPEEAVEHAENLRNTAEASMSDHFLVHFFCQELKMPIEQAVQVLYSFRRVRMKRSQDYWHEQLKKKKESPENQNT